MTVGIGPNGFGSLHHQQGSTTKISEDGIEIRTEYNKKQVCILYKDTRQLLSKRHTHVRIDRISGAIYTATGSTGKAAAEETLRQYNEGRG